MPPISLKEKAGMVDGWMKKLSFLERNPAYRTREDGVQEEEESTEDEPPSPMTILETVLEEIKKDLNNREYAEFFETEKGLREHLSTVMEAYEVDSRWVKPILIKFGHPWNEAKNLDAKYLEVYEGNTLAFRLEETSPGKLNDFSTAATKAFKLNELLCKNEGKQRNNKDAYRLEIAFETLFHMEQRLLTGCLLAHANIVAFNSGAATKEQQEELRRLMAYREEQRLLRQRMAEANGVQ